MKKDDASEAGCRPEGDRQRRDDPSDLDLGTAGADPRPPTPERPHGLTYSLFYGRSGERIVGYDNEAGKGDHRHYRQREEPYRFIDIDRLISDFRADVEREGYGKWPS